VAKGDGGGVGNERGSAHRRGLAVVLAATGLIGRGLTLPSGEEFVPARLEFETNQPTDDVTCISTTDRRIFFSAKRKTGDDDNSLGKTVTQWVAQARSGQPDDVLGLATAQFTTTVEHIRLALKHHHKQPGTTGSVDEQKALTVLKKRIKAAAPGEPELQARVLDAAYVLEVKAVDAEDEDFHVAADRLENKIVAAGQGLAAARALSNAFHDQASQKSGSGLADWVKILVDAGLTVYADGKGPAGVAENARQVALQDYSSRLAGELGRVDLALLVDDVTTLAVDGLADGLRVNVYSPQYQGLEREKLLVIARRWPRMLLTGMPGMGKSTALRQLAARWATDPAAPTPLLIRLPEVAARCGHPSEVTLGLLCEVAAGTSPDEQRPVLAAALQQACEQGHAVLLLDAFDESGHKRALLAEGLATVLSALPQVGVVLATRDSGVRSAQRLELPAAELATPRNLVAILHQLLDQVATARQIEVDQRDTWIARRRTWLSDARRSHDGIGSVPLFAMLMALAMTRSEQAPSAQGQATLLRDAVTESVRRWERRRPGDADTDDQAAQLLDGFAALGALMAASGSASRAEASLALATMLDQRWDLRARGLVGVRTDLILRFWDEQMGVFVTRTDRIEARSRVFAEIGAAMAVPLLDDPAHVADWVAAAVADPGRRTILLMAGELDARVLTALLADAGGVPATRALAAAAIISRGAPADETQYARLLQLLADASEQVEAQAGQPDVLDDWDAWPVAALAGLRLPASLRDQRRQVLARLCDTDDQRLVTAALAVLADAAADGGRPLNEEQARIVRQALTDASPDSRGNVIAHRRGGQQPGLIRVAVESIGHLEVLGADMDECICEIAKGATLGAYADIEEELKAHGYSPAPAVIVSMPEQLSNLVTSVNNDDQVLPLLRASQRMSRGSGECSDRDRWRLPDLCALFDLIRPKNASISGFFDAIQSDADSVRAGWLAAAAAAADLDPAAVAMQAEAAIAEHDHHFQPTVWNLLTAPAPDGPPAVTAALLDSTALDALVNALTTDSEWIAESALKLLQNVTTEQLSDRLDGPLERVPTERRQQIAALIRHIGKEPAERTSATEFARVPRYQSRVDGNG
jgi:hypothetical protein